MKNLILRMAVILTAAATLFYSGCDDGSDSDVTGGGNVDDLIEKTRGTNEPKAPEAYTLKVTITPTAGGTVSKSPDKPQYSKDETVVVTAAVKSGYRFVGWSGSQTSTSDEMVIRIKMDDNKELIANFLPENVVSYSLTLSASPTAGGSVSKSPDKLEYAAGDVVMVTATAKQGYAFSGWSGSQTSQNATMTVTMDGKKEFTANFTHRTYTVTANAENGGTVSRSPGKSAYAYEDKVTVTAYPANGYKFTGWSGAATGTKNPVTVTVDDDLVLTAKFEWQGTTPPNVPDPTYTLYVRTNPEDAGSVSRSPDKSAYTARETVSVTAYPADGYKFTGWSGAATSKNTEITLTMENDKTLTANFELATYMVTFDANGGSGTVSGQSAKYGDNITLPSASRRLTKEGYTFDVWNTNSSGTGIDYGSGSYYTVTGDVTLYAKWEIDTYRVWFDMNGGNNGYGSIPTQRAPYGTSITLPSGNNLTRDGYTFGGWSTDCYGYGTNYSAGSQYTVTDDVDLCAVWNANEYTVTFSANGGNGSIPGQRAKYGTSITLPSGNDLTRSGFTFGGWNTNNSGTGTNYSAGSSFYVYGDVTLYAKWGTVPLYTVTFNSNGGSGSVSSQSAEINSTITLPDGKSLSRNGYTFGGWNTNSSGTGTNYSAGSPFSVTGNVTLYAKWEIIPTYMITFNANGGSVSPTSGVTSADGRLVSLPTPVRSGYTFNGWYTATTGGTVVTTATAFNANTIIYAQWTHTVTFNANSGTVNPTSATTGADGRLTSLPTPTRTGYLFVGWYTASTGGTDVTANTVFSANATIYARWVTIYTVTFNANSGTVSPTSGTTGADGKLASLPTPTRNDHTFSGWYTEATGGTQITTNTIFRENTTIYAQWNRVYAVFTDSRDGKTYKKVVIGTQTWMAENLNYDVPGVTSDVCKGYGNANCEKYGRLYDWFDAMAACPAGWRLPSDAEWTTLTNYVGGSSTAGARLKSTSGWTCGRSDCSKNGTDDFGFTALPAGWEVGYSKIPPIDYEPGGPVYGCNGDTGSEINYGFWWSATKSDDTTAASRSANGFSDAFNRNEGYIGGGYSRCVPLSSVRCIQN
jgi:uncharacterized protein (TIGR02145 family)/uncharacterized repeat protein (TIGR02543 family)